MGSPVEFPWFEDPAGRLRLILLNQALHRWTQNNLQHTDRNNDPFAVVKLETIP